MFDRGSRKVYRVDNEEGAASVAEEVPTSDQLHRCMGHISFQTTKELVKNKLTAGVHLECIPSIQPFFFFCKSCIYAKTARKSIPKSVKEKEQVILEGRCIQTCGGSHLWNLSLLHRVYRRQDKTYSPLLVEER